jgi:hypothetical protein
MDATGRAYRAEGKAIVIGGVYGTSVDRVRRKGTWRRTCIAMGILISLACCKAANEPVSVPPTLRGVWTTTDIRYAGRAFEVSGDRITLATGGEQKDAHPIHRLERRADGRDHLYELTYRNLADNITDTLVLRYEGREGGVIRFKNQPHIEWRRERVP